MSAVLEITTCRPAILPYFAERETLALDTLSCIYRKLAEQDILQDLFPGRHIEEQEFIEFIEESTLTFLLMDLAAKRFVGIAWADTIERDPPLSKARVSIAFFAEYQTPRLTDEFSRLWFSHLYNLHDFGLLYAVIPGSHRVSSAYASRQGFKCHAAIPGFMVYRGAISDMLVCTMDRETFNRRIDGV